jgi:uncharacterized protein DUF4446
MDQNIVLGAAAAAIAIAAAISIVALVKLSGARRALKLFDGSDGQALLDSVAAQRAEVDRLRTEVVSLSSKQQDLFTSLAHSARHVGLVRYDAFEDMGGQVSFSAALLDDFGNGVVITAINGRQEARTYAKTVKAGESDFNLSPEEEESISEAWGRRAKPRTSSVGR